MTFYLEIIRSGRRYAGAKRYPTKALAERAAVAISAADTAILLRVREER